MSKFKHFLEHPEYFLTSPAAKGYLDWVPDKIYLKLLYKAILKTKCHIDKPVTFNEKIQWLKLHDRKPEYIKMVDKYDVREYIEGLFGEDMLIPCYGVYNSWDEIDFDKLPEEFVLKCTHDSGSVEICTDKASWNKDEAKARINAALKRNYYKAYREWPYKSVKPRIIIEKYMVDESGNDLKDYKIMCFNGKAKVIEVHENRFTEGEVHTQTFYTEKWEKLDISQPGMEPAEGIRPRPDKMDEMIAMSEKIAKDMYHVRVDWYIIQDKIYFGEITFYDGSGLEAFSTAENDLYLGNLIELNL